jgi:hypothetical protein
MHARFESCMKTLWQLELGGGGRGQMIKKGKFPTTTQHNIYLHLVKINTLIFLTFFGIN